VPVDKSSAFFALLCFLLSASQVLWGQSESIQDSLHHPGYHFLMIKNPESQAALDGFETDTPYTYFNLSLKNNLYQSFFPPVRTSSDSIQFLTLSGHNRQRLLNGRINDINYIEFNYYTNHHLGTSSRYLLLSFLPAVITAFFDKRQEPLPTLLIGLTYLLPAFTLSGAFTAAAPERYHLDMTEYLERRTSWNWELGYSVGKFSHSIYDYWQYQKAEDTFAQGIYLNLKRNYSPFSFALRLYYMPHPEYDRHFYYDPYYDDYYPEEKVKAGYDMLINPSLKTTIFSSNHFKLNLITGFMTEIRYDYQEPEYPYRYIPAKY